MSKVTYAVWLTIDEDRDAEEQAYLGDPKRYLLATFETEEEAKIFSMELRRKYCPRATGEEEVAIPMNTPDQFTPG